MEFDWEKFMDVVLSVINFIKKPVVKFRNLLNRNKIFFEIIVMGIIAVVSVNLQIQTTQIAKIQNQILIQQNSPNFNIVEKLIFDQESQFYKNKLINVYNSGGFLSQFESRIATFYHIEFSYKEDKEIKSYEVLLPVNEYFYNIEETELTSELLVTHSGDENNYNDFRVEREVHDYLQERSEIQYFNIDTKHYIRIKYIDILNNMMTQYYDITQDNLQIDNEVGQELFKSYYTEEGIDITKISGKELVRKYIR